MSTAFVEPQQVRFRMAYNDEYIMVLDGDQIMYYFRGDVSVSVEMWKAKMHVYNPLAPVAAYIIFTNRVPDMPRALGFTIDSPIDLENE